MSTPTREQILAAHYATEQLVLLATSITESPAVKDYREMILKTLPPKPQPTMADVEWDDDVHYLAEAEQEFLGKVIMLHLNPSDERIRYLQRKGEEARTHYAYPDTLTPTGRRYTLTEVQDD